VLPRLYGPSSASVLSHTPVRQRGTHCLKTSVPRQTLQFLEISLRLVILAMPANFRFYVLLFYHLTIECTCVHDDDDVNNELSAKKSNPHIFKSMYQTYIKFYMLMCTMTTASWVVLYDSSKIIKPTG